MSQPFIGFLFALCAAIMWGTLPIAITQVLQQMNAQTLVWFRFVVAALGLLLWLAWRKKLPNLTALNQRFFLLILLGIAGLAANFYLFNLALHYIPPATSQILSPVTSFIMLFASVALFNEPLNRYQKRGLFLLIFGLIAFFNDKLQEFLRLSDYSLGVTICFIASCCWVAYALAQKLLLRVLTAPQVLLIFYCGCGLLFTPIATPSQGAQLSNWQLICLLYCCANTLIAYGCYGEALNRWQLAKVSAVMTQIPVFSLVFADLAAYCAPHIFRAQSLNGLSYFGAVLVVSGALLSAIGQQLFARRGNV